MAKQLRSLASVFGLNVLTHANYQILIKQRDNAVGQIAAHERTKLTYGVRGVVFSKDRAIQLHALLRTYFLAAQNPAPLIALYSASSQAHSSAYLQLQLEVQQKGLQVDFIAQGESFRSSFLEILQNITTQNIFFLVDDIVFLRPFDMDLAAKVDPQKEVLSWRHSPHLRYSYTSHCQQNPPSFTDSSIHNGLLEFLWFAEGNEWSNPLSVDGQILSTAEIKVLSSITEYKAPNSLEGVWVSFGSLYTTRKGLCFKNSVIVNLPINRVQTEVKNLSGTINPEYLLQKWNEGMMLDTNSLWGYQPKSPHEEHALSYIPRVWDK